MRVWRFHLKEREKIIKNKNIFKPITSSESSTSRLDERQNNSSQNPGFGDLRSPCLKSRAQTIYAAFFFNRCSSEYISCRNPDHFRQLSICEVQNFLILIFECSSNHRARKKSLTMSCCYQWRWQGLLRVVTTTTIKSKLT